MQADLADAAPAAARTKATAALDAALRSHAGQVALVLALAFILRLAWVLFTEWQPTPDDDAFRYDFAARALADGRGYVHLNDAPTAFWPPGYPLLLATAYVIFGQHVVVAQLLNVALSTATVGLVYLIGRRTLGRHVALAGASVVAFWPSLIFLTGVTLSEVAFTFFALLGVYLLVLEAQGDRPRDPSASSGQAPSASSGQAPSASSGRSLRRLLAAGLVLGFAALVRGQALLLPLVLVPFWRCSGIEWRRIGHKLVALALGIGLIVAPWTIRNAVELDAPVLISTNAGVDFWIGHHESAAGDFGPTGGDALVFSHPELTTVEREVRVNTEGFQKGLAYAVSHPAQELVLPFKKLFWLYYNDEEGLKWNEGHGGQPFLPGWLREGLLGLSNVYYFAVLGLLFLGVRAWLSLREPGRLLLISLVAYWTLVHLIFFGDPRFHAPIMPLIALLAALPWVGLRLGRQAPPERA